MIKAIVFDCFGVLTEDGWLAFQNKWVQPDQQDAAQELNHQNDRGQLDYSEFLDQLCNLTGAPRAEADNMIRHNHHRNAQLFELITKLKAEYKLGLLSNIASNYLDEFFTAKDIALFDALSLSGESGFVKPEVGAYQDISSKLSVEPDESVFIDDRDGFVAGALSYGMHGIHYQSYEQTFEELNTILANN